MLLGWDYQLSVVVTDRGLVLILKKWSYVAMCPIKRIPDILAATRKCIAGLLIIFGRNVSKKVSN